MLDTFCSDLGSGTVCEDRLFGLVDLAWIPEEKISSISSSNIDLASTFFLDFSFGFTVRSAKISILSSNKLESNVLSFSLIFCEGLIASVANISSSKISCAFEVTSC